MPLSVPWSFWLLCNHTTIKKRLHYNLFLESTFYQEMFWRADCELGSPVRITGVLFCQAVCWNVWVFHNLFNSSPNHFDVLNVNDTVAFIYFIISIRTRTYIVSSYWSVLWNNSFRSHLKIVPTIAESRGLRKRRWQNPISVLVVLSSYNEKQMHKNIQKWKWWGTQQTLRRGNTIHIDSMKMRS